MDNQNEKKLLNTLKSIDNTLKCIEQSLATEKQCEVIKEAVSDALTGKEKYKRKCGKSPFIAIIRNLTNYDNALTFP